MLLVSWDGGTEGKGEGGGGAAYDPDRGGKQAQLNARQAGVRGFDDHGAVVLHADAHAHNPEIHHQQRPQPPVQKHAAQLPESPGRRVVHALQIAVVDVGVAAGERRRRGRDPAREARARGWGLAGRGGSVGEPPE